MTILAKIGYFLFFLCCSLIASENIFENEKCNYNKITYVEYFSEQEKSEEETCCCWFLPKEYYLSMLWMSPSSSEIELFFLDRENRR